MPVYFRRLIALPTVWLTAMTVAAAAQTNSLGTAAQGAQTTMSQARGWFTQGGDALTNFFMNYVFGNLFPGPQTSSLISKIILTLNLACLAIAAMFAIYQILQGVTQTAHSGRLLGEQHSFWGPVRLAIAALLLIPLPNQSYYNTGQVLVAWLVKGGSAAATAVWKGAVTAIGSQTITAENTAGISPDVAHAIWNMSVCEAAINALTNQVQNGTSDPATGAFSGGATMTAAGWTQQYPGNNGGVFYGASNGANTMTTAGSDAAVTMSAPAKNTKGLNAYALLGVCGQVSGPETPTVLVSGPGADQGNFQKAWTDALSSLKASMDSGAQALVKAVIQVESTDMSALSGAAKFSDMLKSVNIGLQQSVGQIAATWSQANPISLAMTSTNQTGSCASSAGASISASDVKNCYPASWLSAGAYYMAISKTTGAVMAISSATASVTRQTSWGSYAQSLTSASSNSGATTPYAVYQKIANAADNLWSASGMGGLSMPAIGATNQAATADKATNSPKTGENVSDGSGYVSKLGLSSDMLQRIYAAITSQEVGQDPLQGVIKFGQLIVTVALSLFAAGALLAATAIGGSVALYFLPIIATLLGVGYIFGFIIPLLPFVTWIISVVSYFIIIAEAIVAVNLWAIAHMRFAGEGVAGAAQAGYQILLAICLTPLLMVAGMLAGMLVMWVGGTLVNLGWSTIWSVGPTSIFSSLIYLIAMSVVFAYLYWMLAEKSFFLIGEFPSRIFRWIGHSESALTRGEEREIRQGAIAAGYTTGRVTNAVGSGAYGAIKRRRDARAGGGGSVSNG